MSSWTPQWFGRRPLQSRIRIVFHASPEAVSVLLPEGIRARLLASRAVLALSFTKVGPHGFLGGRLTFAAEHLSIRVAVWIDAGAAQREGAFLLDRSRSSWLASRAAQRLLGVAVRPAEFLLEEDHLGVTLRARSGEREHCSLRAHAARDLSSKLFASPREAELFLCPPGEPRAPFAFEEDAARDDAEHALEPLRIFELRSEFFDDARRFPPDSLVLDCAFRAVEHRLAFSEARARHAPANLLRGPESSPALPAL